MSERIPFWSSVRNESGIGQKNPYLGEVSPLYSQNLENLSDDDPRLGPSEPWDRVRLGNRLLPGLAKVSSSGLTRKLDIAMAPGYDGGTLTDHGREPITFLVELTLWTDEQWRRWEEIFASLRPSLGRAGKSYVVRHPMMRLMQVGSVYLRKISAPEPGPILDARHVTLDLVESRPMFSGQVRVLYGSSVNIGSAMGGRTAIDASPPTKPSEDPVMLGPPLPP